MNTEKRFRTREPESNEEQITVKDATGILKNGKAQSHDKLAAEM